MQTGNSATAPFMWSPCPASQEGVLVMRENRVSGIRNTAFEPEFDQAADASSARDEQQGQTILPSPRRFAILTCMDARIDPAKLTGLPGSDAHVVRNAGARATDDAIRSLVLSHKLLGTTEWFVVQHSHCGMALLTEELMRELLAASAKPALSDAMRIGVPSAREVGNVGKLAIRDQEQSLTADVMRIRNHPLVPASIPIYGYVYHVETGQFVEVPQASAIGARTLREATVLRTVAS
jgi:carbonic anhydrase